MTDSNDEIVFQLELQRTPGAKQWWFVVPLEMSETVTLALVPNTVASRSVITPLALDVLRSEGLVGADILDIQTGLASCVLAGCRLGGQSIPELEVRVRDVAQQRNPNGDYDVDGYLGIDFFFGICASLAIDTRTRQVRLRLQR